MDSTLPLPEQLEKVNTELRRLLDKGCNSEKLNLKRRKLMAEINGWKFLAF